MLKRIYQSVVAKHRDAVSFIVLFFFLVMFTISRIYNYLNAAGIIPDSLMLNRNIRGVHVHHLAFGIIILSITGYLALVLRGRRITHLMAIFYGIGLALAYDEFGMWLRLSDDYWIRQSYDAVAIISVILINIVYFNKLWEKIFLKMVSVFLQLNHKRLTEARRSRLLRQGRAK